LGSAAVIFVENATMPNPVNFNAPDRAQPSLNPAWRQDRQVQAALDAEDWVGLFAYLQNWLRGSWT
jgi:hypothetical protein